jgi:hypothetical protein
MTPPQPLDRVAQQTVYNRRWRSKHPEVVKAYNAAYYQKHKAKIRARRIEQRNAAIIQRVRHRVRQSHP